MKNVQIIDGANNSAYSIYSFSDDGFNLIFPEEGQDIEFIEDFLSRMDKEISDKILSDAWKNEISKKQVSGIHGTLFYELSFEKKFYPNKRESDLKNSLIQGNPGRG